jgi:hypothetical protein
MLADDRTFDKGGPFIDAFRAESWRDGEVVDVPATMHELTMTIMCRTLLEAETSAADIAELRRCIEAVSAGVDHGDVLSLLLAARDDDGNGLTDTEIHDEVVQFLLASMESTPPLILWAVLLLDRHPDVLARLHTEVDAVLTGRVARYDGLSRLDPTARIVVDDRHRPRRTSTSHPVPPSCTAHTSPATCCRHWPCSSWPRSSRGGDCALCLGANFFALGFLYDDQADYRAPGTIARYLRGVHEMIAIPLRSPDTPLELACPATYALRELWRG